MPQKITLENVIESFPAEKKEEVTSTIGDKLRDYDEAVSSGLIKPRIGRLPNGAEPVYSMQITKYFSLPKKWDFIYESAQDLSEKDIIFVARKLESHAINTKKITLAIYRKP